MPRVVPDLSRGGALTLVPDYHLVVLRAEQIVAGVPDAVAAVDPARPGRTVLMSTHRRLLPGQVDSVLRMTDGVLVREEEMATTSA
jgi:hypothetical protein